jgi:hypothetical protein
VRCNLEKKIREDMHSPSFFVGQVFSSIEAMLRKAIISLSIVARTELI